MRQRSNERQRLEIHIGELESKMCALDAELQLADVSAKVDELAGLKVVQSNPILSTLTPLPGSSLKGVALTEVSPFASIHTFCSCFLSTSQSPFASPPQVFQHSRHPILFGIVHSHPQHSLHSFKSLYVIFNYIFVVENKMTIP